MNAICIYTEILYKCIFTEEEPSSASTLTSSDMGLMGLLQQPTTNTMLLSPTEATTVDKHSLTPPDGPPFKRRRYFLYNEY
jgi:hypothetical protein